MEKRANILFVTFDEGGNLPPVFGLLPGKGIAARMRDRVISKLFNVKLNQFLPGINEVRTQMNLPLLKQTSDLMHGADLRLIQTMERFDFPLEPRPANVRYTGLVTLGPALEKDRFSIPENVIVVKSARRTFAMLNELNN